MKRRRDHRKSDAFSRAHKISALSDTRSSSALLIISIAFSLWDDFCLKAAFSTTTPFFLAGFKSPVYFASNDDSCLILQLCLFEAAASHASRDLGDTKHLHELLNLLYKVYQ